MDEVIESAARVAQANPSNIPQPMSKEEWVRDYWFNDLQMITVVNPQPIDWEFMVENRHFMIPAGAEMSFPGVIANVYLDQMSKIQAQDDDKLGYMADPSLRKLYYDKLIVKITSQVKEYTPKPAWQREPAPATPKVEEKAPWTEDTAPVAPEAPEPPKAPVKAESKAFEHNGVKYKLTVAKDGKEMYFKDGKMTSSAEYFKAASLL